MLDDDPSRRGCGFLPGGGGGGAKREGAQEVGWHEQRAGRTIKGDGHIQGIADDKTTGPKNIGMQGQSTLALASRGDRGGMGLAGVVDCDRNMPRLAELGYDGGWHVDPVAGTDLHNRGAKCRHGSKCERENDIVSAGVACNSHQMKKNQVGAISWTDLTVPDAVRVSDFYAAVVGWETMGIDMGGYQDFCMMPPGSKKPAGGICHARGDNQNLPAQWLVYITVADLRASLKTCLAQGGKIVAPLRDMGMGKMAVIQDPAGAVAALFEHAAAAPAKKPKVSAATKAKKQKRAKKAK